jgi:hypothetical protein
VPYLSAHPAGPVSDDLEVGHAFHNLQSLLGERCKSVERSRTKYNSVLSSKSGCRSRKREVFGRHY